MNHALGATKVARPIRVLLADDHVMVREGTRRILEREDDLEVVAEAGDGRETIDLAAQTLPDVVVVRLRRGRIM